MNETERKVAKKKVTIRDENKKENEEDRQMKKKEIGQEAIGEKKRRRNDVSESSWELSTKKIN